VPGVEVYAYACHPAVARWGRAWLERGAAECRFLNPVYDGRLARVTAQAADEGLDLRVESEGVHCAEGRAWLHSDPPPHLAAYERRTPPAERPPASEATLAPGTALASHPLQVTAELAADYLRGVGETDPLYAAEGLVHPGQILRLCNQPLMQNVLLGPWIHVGSKVRNFSVARVGDALTALARVAAEYERKGHRFVELDMVVATESDAVVAHVRHTALYRPRQLAG
jgi:acyl dehydratase